MALLGGCARLRRLKEQDGQGRPCRIPEGDMKKIALWTGGAVAAIAVVLLVMPTDRLYRLQELGQRMTNGDAVACLDYERESLKDPGSARLLSSSPGKDERYIRIRYKARNGYGAYGSSEAVCARGLGSGD